jgi:hypothetical protein
VEGQADFELDPLDGSEVVALSRGSDAGIENDKFALPDVHLRGLLVGGVYLVRNRMVRIDIDIHFQVGNFVVRGRLDEIEMARR